MEPKGIIGSHIIRLDRIDSTNTYLLNHIDQQHFPNGTLVITTDQYRGKGLNKNTWESEPGKNLTFSFLLYPDFLSPEQQFMLNVFVSLGIYDFINQLGINSKVKIKWPNDVYLGEQKVCGILINNTIKGSEIAYTVIGIGINVNQAQFTSDAPNPVSLKQITGFDYNLDTCLHQLLDRLNKRLIDLASGQILKLNQDYRDALYRLRIPSKFVHKNHFIEGEILGVSQYGQLKIKNQFGEICHYGFKEIEFLI